MSKSTLDSIVIAYRRAIATASSANIELEVRISNMNYHNFEMIFNGFYAEATADGATASADDASSSASDAAAAPPNPIISQSVNVIMPSARRIDGPQKMLTPNNVKEIQFKNGVRSDVNIIEKTKLEIPARVNNPVGLSYMISVASEKESRQDFMSDENALIRIKLRVSFLIKITSTEDPSVQLPWRIDMTIVRKINGSDAKSSLSHIIKQMFSANEDPKRILTHLNLLEENSPNRRLYSYETEAEFVGEGSIRELLRSADVINVANKVLHMSNPEHNQDILLQNEIFNVAKHLVRNPSVLQEYQTNNGLKQLLPSVISLTRTDYRKIYKPVGYFVTEKADGKRGLAVVRGGASFLLSDKLYMIQQAPIAAPVSKTISETILDGEIIIDETTGTVKFFAFDILMISNTDMTQIGFEHRVNHIQQGVETLKANGIDAYAKKYLCLTDDEHQIETAIREIYEGEHKYEIDGLIMVQPGANYLKTISYKWKPASHNTIDMLARKAPPELLNKAPFISKPGHTLYFLFVGISNTMFNNLGIHWCPGYRTIFHDDEYAGDNNNRRYFPIQFAPSDVPLAYLYYHPDGAAAAGSAAGTDISNKIVEMRCGGSCEAAGGERPTVNWELVKVREDRSKDLLSGNYFGNNFKTAEMVWLNYVDPFPIEQLWGGLGGNYFMVNKTGTYKAQTAMTNFVKNKRIMFSLNHLDWVVDIGAGKGQDIKRYVDAGVHNLIAVDQDKSAISELIRRKHQIAAAIDTKFSSAKSHRGMIKQRDFSTNIRALIADVSKKYTETYDKLLSIGLPTVGANALVCNLAVHYFFDTTENIQNFIMLTKSVVKIGGIVVLTIIDGEKVHKMLTDAKIPYDGSLDMIEEADSTMTKKYSIKRLYKSDRLEKAGQKISLILPFSNGEYYEENLVNPSYFVTEFNKREFTLIEKTNILDSMPEFESRSPPIAKLLTDFDKKWLSLYGELIFKREK